ncbi:hypothetical protein EK21DRAFT_116131 [Setomelanomma holmii]|uniref:Uncharacterized protein n=1 Tax=Setomelanomma holmii TaxID=210430 RepID=A0A9P4H209_9PLEO|nr:hypothetical protein EK21DRAFT_116131 [Setomelanomma holmii]
MPPQSFQTRLIILLKGSVYRLKRSEQRTREYHLDLLTLANSEHEEYRDMLHPEDSLYDNNAIGTGVDADDHATAPTTEAGDTNADIDSKPAPSKRALEIRIHEFRMAEQRAKHSLIRYEVAMRNKQDLEAKKSTSQERWKKFCAGREERRVQRERLKMRITKGRVLEKGRGLGEGGESVAAKVG